MNRELRRISQIDRQLVKSKKRFRKISYVFAQVESERREVARQIRALEDERSSLSQGQLMLNVPRGTIDSI